MKERMKKEEIEKGMGKQKEENIENTDKKTKT